MKKVGRIMKVLAVPLVLLLAGCVRNLQEPAKITLKVPATWQGKNSTQGGEGELIYAVINVRGEGIPGGLIFWNWLADSLKHNQTNPLSSITIEVPSGPNRTIQYVGVYRRMDETQGARYLLIYGDTLLDELPSGDVPVTIKANELLDAEGGGSSEVQLDILAGRYLNGENSGPTTVLTGSLYIPAAKSSLKKEPPPVDMFKVGMFDGWFKTLLFPRAQLTWRTASGEVVADKVSSESLGILSTTQNRAKFLIPKHYRPTPNSTAFSLSSAQQVSLGWFGQTSLLGEKYICYVSGLPSSLIVPGLFASATSTSSLPWDSTSCTSQPAMAVCPTGGARVSETQQTDCSNYGREGVDYLRPVHRSFGHEFDSILAFNGPFKLREEEILSGRVILASYDSSAQKYTVTWQYVSAAAATALGGVSVYAKSTSEITRHDAGQIAEGMNCDERAKLIGYAHLGDASPTDGTADRGSFVWQASPVDPDMKFVLCPFTRKAGEDKKYFPSFVSSESIELTNVLVNLNYQIFDVNETVMNTPITQPFENTCYKIELTLASSAPQSSNYTYKLQAFNGTWGSTSASIFYTGADLCLIGVTSQPETIGTVSLIGSGETRVFRYVKFPFNQGGTFTLLSSLADSSNNIVVQKQSIISVNGSGGGQQVGSGSP